MEKEITNRNGHYRNAMRNGNKEKGKKNEEQIILRYWLPCAVSPVYMPLTTWSNETTLRQENITKTS